MCIRGKGTFGSLPADVTEIIHYVPMTLMEPPPPAQRMCYCSASCREQFALKQLCPQTIIISLGREQEVLPTISNSSTVLGRLRVALTVASEGGVTTAKVLQVPLTQGVPFRCYWTANSYQVQPVGSGVGTYSPTTPGEHNVGYPCSVLSSLSAVCLDSSEKSIYRTLLCVCVATSWHRNVLHKCVKTHSCAHSD